MLTVRQTKRLSRLIALGLTAAIVVGLFFIRIGTARNAITAQSDVQSGQRFFTMQRYNIIPEQSIRKTQMTRRQQNKMTKPAESQPPISETSHQPNPETTEQSEQIKSEPAHSQNETAAETPQNETAAETPQNETAKPSGSIIGKKSNSKNIIEYKPDFTIDKMPVYPMSARRLGQQGTVGVNAYIDGSGKVLNVVAARSSGVKSLDEAAVAAVRCWSFGSLRLPDKMNIVRTEIVFKLE